MADAAVGGENKGRNVMRRIFDCAVELFQKYGFENVKVTDICSAAEVAVGTFYYYFPSKDSLFLGYADASDEYMEERAKKARAESKSASELLKRLIKLKIECIEEVGAETLNVGWIAELKLHRDVSLDMHRVAYKSFMDAIEDGMRSGEFRSDLNLFTVTGMLRYMIGGLLIRWAIEPDSVDLKEETDRIADTFVDMLRNN